jgi:amino acid transporter
MIADSDEAGGLAYTYNSRGLGPAAGFLTGWMMIFAYALFVPAGVGLIRAFRTEYRDEFRLVPHLLIPAAASVVFLFPLWGILLPGAYTLANLLPFISLGWLLIGAIAAGILRARRPATFQALGRVVAPNLDKQLELD